MTVEAMMFAVPVIRYQVILSSLSIQFILSSLVLNFSQRVSSRVFDVLARLILILSEGLQPIASPKHSMSDLGFS